MRGDNLSQDRKSAKTADICTMILVVLISAECHDDISCLIAVVVLTRIVVVTLAE